MDHWSTDKALGDLEVPNVGHRHHPARGASFVHTDVDLPIFFHTTIEIVLCNDEGWRGVVEGVWSQEGVQAKTTHI